MFVIFGTKHLGKKKFDDINIEFTRQNETLVPYFAFYDHEKKLFENEAKQLWKQVKQRRTCKERYIANKLTRYFDENTELDDIVKIEYDEDSNIIDIIQHKVKVKDLPKDEL